MYAAALKNDPDDTLPLPWWTRYVIRSKQWGVPPWELLDVKTPKAYWMVCGDMMDEAVAALHEKNRHTNANSS